MTDCNALAAQITLHICRSKRNRKNMRPAVPLDTSCSSGNVCFQTDNVKSYHAEMGWMFGLAREGGTLSLLLPPEPPDTGRVDV